jgi:preprotein translocase subunit SecF
MELFKQTNIDFLGNKWPFLIASALLLAAGIGSLIVRGGPRYGIDFKGGAMVYVKFAERPPIDKVRSALASRLPGGMPDIQEVTGSNELIIGTELKESRELEEAQRVIIDTLASTFGGGDGRKFDINRATQSSLVERLRGPLAGAGMTLGEKELAELSAAILEFRNTPPRSGLIRNFDELKGVQGVTSQVIATLKQEAYAAPYTIRNTEMVGPKIGKELRYQAVMATLYALAGMLIYIGLRFEWVSGLAAVLAVVHDTLITIGLLSIFNFEISLTVVAALLTLVGYSMNDTVVLFDRVRENLKLMKRDSLTNLINVSVNQTLSRTLLTGGLTFLSAVCLLIFGGPVLRGFSFTFVVGIIVGTYSSIFIATPIVILVHRALEDRKRKQHGGTASATPAAVEAGRKRR